MQIEISPEVDKELRKIKQKDSQLTKRIEKQLKFFSENPKHPSLRIHKLAGELNDLWSISITESIRLTYIQDGEIAYFIKIGKHEEVYKK